MKRLDEEANSNIVWRKAEVGEVPPPRGNLGKKYRDFEDTLNKFTRLYLDGSLVCSKI